MKLPRELIDRVSSFIPILNRGSFLSTLSMKPWESDRQQMSLWTMIFKNDHWLTEVTEKNNARLVIIGAQLSQVSSDSK